MADAKEAAPPADKAKKEKKPAKEAALKITEYENKTPAGEKKDMNEPLLPTYNPKAVEAAWYEWWVKKGFFTADPNSPKPKYVIVIPPPNVTGSLHLGHALTNSIQDAITRWRRMSGYECLWLPGTDHAGIATQVVVEKKLKRDRNITRHDLGRDAFVAEVWKWKEQYGNRICTQLRRMGSSLDWTREHFTMDDQLSRAVRVSFVRLFEEGLIYREKRLVNWDCALKSAISDLEVEYIQLDKPQRMRVPGHQKTYEFGYLTEFAYKVDGSDDEIVVATTRLETMLGDTAVAVHPDDSRYKHLHGKMLVHPFVARKIPIITDAELVDMSFGTGAVKVTPAHDPNDYVTGKKHGLPMITVFTDDGAMNDNAGEFKGMMRFDAREACEKRLEELKLLRGKTPNPGQRLGTCTRSGDIIEPMLKPQWWMNCKPLAEAAINATKEGKLEIVPEFQRDTWFRWLENIRDWCISRQLWWGHRIPAYYATLDGEPATIPLEEDPSRWFSHQTEAEAAAAAAQKFPGRKITMVQDEDVLDTWYSSGLFPFSTMGWPDTNCADFKAFYPTSLLETGHDILFFWVARMVMMGIKLTGQVPFSQVYLHAMVRDKYGRKMTKSLGNVVDPVDVIEGISLPALHDKLKEGNLDPREVEKAIQGQKADYPEGIAECGTDALRFALCAYTLQGRDINLDVNRVVGYRQFCNKIWNATKYAMNHLGAAFKPDPVATMAGAGMRLAERWILHRLNAAVEKANASFAAFEFAIVTTEIYNFWLYDFCDVYLELSKPAMALDDSSEENRERKRVTRNVLYTCLDAGLRLLSPFMPFVSEELWQRLPRRPDEHWESICVAAYPRGVAAWADGQAEERMKLLLDVAKEARSMRTAYGLAPQLRPTFFFTARSPAVLQLAAEEALAVRTLVQAGEFTPVPSDAEVPKGCGMRPVNETCELHLVLKGMVDFEKEIKALEKKKETLNKSIDTARKRAAGPQYDKVPANVREADAARLAASEAELEAVCKAIANFASLRDS
eukprot:tig00001130_g7234.t1